MPDAPITKEYVTNLPYASLGARIGSGQRSFLVLGRYDGPDRHWISSDGAALVTRHGRLIRLYGVSPDLRDTQGVEDDPIAAATFDFAGRHTRSVDLGIQGQYGIPIESTFEVVGRENVTILGDARDTLHVREHNQARQLRWTFENEFWLDFETGYVWRSSQHFAPGAPPVVIEIYKRDA